MGERNEIIYADGFWKDTRKLPKEAREKLPELFNLLAKNAFDPLLRVKPLGHPLIGRYSFRITRDWRVTFRFEDDHRIKVLMAGNRDNIYRRLKRIS
ncbi:MAG: hypothetical protein HY221_00255 [Candidatus Sungbacteria bacterium]|uniref:Type II toxin-antitoxin system RelE/ParE family toxin n=1 Tax=Candidatus Sungiibacteriota bacterium TaxID=2750080 RepID=A0A932VS35_9BACT|nr:hypothetical protein [Candidatus Sungbacteria bacterium]